MPKLILIIARGTSPLAVGNRARLDSNHATNTDRSLTGESFEKFLCWLSPDRDEAGKKYKQLRTELVKLFAWRGCSTPEELFDTTVDRAAKR